MNNIQFSPMSPETLSASLAINDQYVDMLSPLTCTELKNLIFKASYAMQTGKGRAFLLAFNQNAAYDGINFNWFKARYERFIYIDRIVVGEEMQRQGVASAFYEDITNFSRKHDATHLCAEVNIEPPNPASHGFHQKFGFVAVGDAHVGGKHVQYYVKTL